MTYQSFPIVDYSTGLFTAKESWLSPNDAFVELNNAAISRGKVKKRQGSETVAYAVSRVGTLAGGATDYEDSSDLVEVQLTSHGLTTGDYIVIQSATGTGASGLNDKRFFITRVDANNFTLDDVTYSGLGLDGTTQDGTIDKIKALTKAEKIAAAGITQAERAVVTTSSAHGLTTGNTVQIVEEEGSAISGMTEIIGATSTITVLTTTKFELDNVDSTNYTAHTSGGTVALVDVDADPITGMFEYTDTSGNKSLLVASTTRLSQFTGDASNAVALSTSDDFSGTATDYFQFAQFGEDSGGDNFVYMTNNVDAPFEWNGSGAPTSHSFGSTGVTKARMILPYKQRLIVLNTTEGGSVFPQRVRWTSLFTSPTTTPDWDSGSALDASTSDVIVGAQFLKDTLIVFFSNSVWALKDTGSADIPFRWEKIDNLSTLIDAQFSVIGHENAVWAFGLGGWILSDGFQVRSFDTPIPDFPDFIGPDERTILFSVRNLAKKQIWMAYPTTTQTRNNNVLVYNFETPSFSKYDHDFNVASEFNKETAGVTWNDIDEQWDQVDETWDSFIQRSGFPELFIGTEAGFIKRVNQDASDDGTNINLDIKTKRLVPFPDRQAQLGWVDLLLSVEETTTVTLEAFSDWDPTSKVSQTLTVTSDIPGQDKVWKRFYINLISPSFVIRISHNQPYPFELHAMVPYFRPAGRLI